MPTFGEKRNIITEEPSVLPDFPSEDRVLRRDCPVCPEQISVVDLGRDTLGIGMSTSGAATLEALFTAHLEEHDAADYLIRIEELKDEIEDLARLCAETAAELKTMKWDLSARTIQLPRRPMDPGYDLPAAPPPGVHESEELASLRAENDLLKSRQAQENYDPLKATPRYSQDLPAGVVGVRR